VNMLLMLLSEALLLGRGGRVKEAVEHFEYWARPFQPIIQVNDRPFSDCQEALQI
jgi:hypothetical protein